MNYSLSSNGKKISTTKKEIIDTFVDVLIQSSSDPQADNPLHTWAVMHLHRALKRISGETQMETDISVN